MLQYQCQSCTLSHKHTDSIFIVDTFLCSFFLLFSLSFSPIIPALHFYSKWIWRLQLTKCFRIVMISFGSIKQPVCALHRSLHAKTWFGLVQVLALFSPLRLQHARQAAVSALTIAYSINRLSQVSALFGDKDEKSSQIFGLHLKLEIGSLEKKSKIECW